MKHAAIFLLAATCVFFLATTGCTQSTPAGQSLAPSVSPTAISALTESSQKLVRLETTMGNITLELYPYMPVTAGNFESLVKSGFYNGVILHRVMDGFMIQGGDPTGTGRGGPGYTIPDEFTSRNQNSRGTISMANAGPDTGGSQFFINLVDNNYLNTKHPVFGKVVEGMDVVDAIGRVPTDSADRPLQDVVIIRAVLL